MITYLTDTALNDSNKSFTVPSGEQYQLLGGLAELVTTATVGNRQIELRITDGTNTVLSIVANGTQAASLTRQYQFVQGEAAPAAAVGTIHVCPVPAGLILLPDWTIQVLDSAAVDAAADDMTLRLVVDQTLQFTGKERVNLERGRPAS